MSFLRKLLISSLFGCSITGLSAQIEDWYSFQPDNHGGPSVIGMETWFEGAAGDLGRVERREDALYYGENPIKLWGLNISFAACAPLKEMADRRVDFYRKIGVNSVRLHKYADGTNWAGILTEDSFLEFDPEKLDRMDYFVARMKAGGIFVKLSPTFGVKVGRADADRIPYLDELGRFREGPDARIRAKHGAVFLSRELQDMQIEQLVKILNHRNPHTGMRYAEDPAIAFVEMFNEDAVLYYSTNNRLRESPTLRARAATKFSQWLAQKYEDDAGLLAAWGEAAFDVTDMLGNVDPDSLPEQSILAGTVVPWGNQSYYAEATRGEKTFRRQRMLDTMVFMTTLQDDFYDRFLKAIRETGYEGEVISSNWQAGNGISHFHNLYSDSRIGVIDRHNYFGGPRQTREKGRINTHSMLADPGSGILSSGMQQVANRPFMLSEWIHEQPNEWQAEGPAIIGTYGMGLNGWDASYMFQNDDLGGFSDRMGRSTWDVSLPQVAGLFPAISRMVHRADITEPPLTFPIKVHPASLAEGKLGVHDFTEQDRDIKSFDSTEVPNDALAVGRVAVEFTDSYMETPQADLTSARDGRTLVSTTGQLRWTPAPEGEAQGGYFTIDTPATKAFVGFSPGDIDIELAGVTIRPEQGFSAIYLTAHGKGENLGSSQNWILIAMARARNTDSQYSDSGDQLEALGEAPILLEPVRAEIVIARDIRRVVRLDHDGRETEKQLSLEPYARSFKIDGKWDRTPFYLIQF